MTLQTPVQVVLGKHAGKYGIIHSHNEKDVNVKFPDGEVAYIPLHHLAFEAPLVTHSRSRNASVAKRKHKK